MVKKLALTSLFSSSNKEYTSSSSPSSPSFSASSNPPVLWPWPSCKPRTLSFREDGRSNADHHKAYKTMNSAYFLDSADSCFSNSFASADMSESLSTASEASGGEAEAVVRGLRSDRLFFEPESTSSILRAAKGDAAGAFDGALAMSIDSDDPYLDFRRSMEEMVMSHGVKDWGWLEEMLGWYLKANGKKNHGLIVGAFVDLLVGLTSPSPAAAAPPCSSFTGLDQAGRERTSESSCHDPKSDLRLLS